jgi:D-alanyl-D-alanine carboxypeptidase/D-alanyl-D-alanine-endopeptidase (penicillin-binding protein 4)
VIRRLCLALFVGAWTLHPGALSAAPPAAATATATPPVAAPAPSADPVANDAATLKLRIDEILAQKPLAGATIGVHAVDLATGEVLYSRNPDVPQNPASNIKLVTTAAALALLGPEHRYVTRVYAARKSLKGPPSRATSTCAAAATRP